MLIVCRSYPFLLLHKLYQLMPIVMVNFWCPSRSRHVSYHLRGTQAANRLFANRPNMSASLTWAQRESLGPCPSPHLFGATYPDPQLIRSCTVPRRLQSSLQKLSPDTDTKTLWSLPPLRWLQLSGAIPVIRGFRYGARSPLRFKRYNAQYQYGLLWIVTDISAWKSQQSSGAIWAVIIKLQHANLTVVEIWSSNVCINSSPSIYIVSSPTGRGWAIVRFWLPLKTHTSIVYFSSNKDTYSHAQGSSTRTTPVLLTGKVFSLFLCF